MRCTRHIHEAKITNKTLIQEELLREATSFFLCCDSGKTGPEYVDVSVNLISGLAECHAFSQEGPALSIILLNCMLPYPGPYRRLGSPYVLLDESH